MKRYRKLSKKALLRLLRYLQTEPDYDYACIKADEYLMNYVNNAEIEEEFFKVKEGKYYEKTY
jgi:hypothetical protein